MPINIPVSPRENENIRKVEPSKPNLSEVEDIFEHESKDIDIPEVTPETTIEQPIEKITQPETVEVKPEDFSKEDEQSQRHISPQPAQVQIGQVQPKSMDQVKIENILSENLDDLFLKMTPQEQMSFKQKGEETAIKVNKLLQETKVKVKEIIILIKEWLKIIPGVNKFFIEQEAKIKTDRLLNLREQKNK